MKLFFLKTIQVISAIVGGLSLLFALRIPDLLLVLTLPMAIICITTEFAIRSAKNGKRMSVSGRFLLSIGAIIGGLVCGSIILFIGSLTTLDTGIYTTGAKQFVVIGVAVAASVTLTLVVIINKSPAKSNTNQPADVHATIETNSVADKLGTDESTQDGHRIS